MKCTPKTERPCAPQPPDGRRKAPFLFLLIALLVLGGGCGPFKPAHQETVPLPMSEKVITGTLANGLRYYIRQNPYPKDRVELRLNVRSGSLNETEEERGLAHFVEHMAFNGIRHFKHNELIAFLEEAGLTFGSHTNAYTSTDVTNYQLSIPLDRPELLDKAFLVLGDWADGLLFDEGEIEKEKGVIVEEWRMREGVRKRVGDKSRAVLLSGSRYPLRDPIGLMPVVKGANRALLKGYYDANYTPDRMAVVVVGNIDAADMQKRIEKAMGGIAPRKARAAAPKEVPLTPGLRVTTITDPELTAGTVAVDHFFQREPTTTYEGFKRDLTEQLAFAAFNRRVRKKITDRELPLLRAYARVTDVQSDLHTARFMARPVKGSVSEGLSGLYAEMERVRRFGFLAEELTEQKSAFQKALTEAARPDRRVESSDHAAAICEFDTHGGSLTDPDQDLALYLKAAGTITTVDLNRSFNRLLASESRSVTFTFPEKRKTETLSKPEIMNLATKVQGEALSPYTLAPAITALVTAPPKGGDVLKTEKMPVIDGQAFTLSNGTRLVVKPTAHAPGEFLIRGTATGGLSSVPDADYKRVSMAAGLVNQSGFAGIPQTELNRFLAGRNINVSPSIEANATSLTGGGATKEAETLFQMLRLYFTAPNVSAKALSIHKARMTQTINARAHDKKFWFTADAAEARHNNKFRDQPLAIEDLKGLTPEALLADYTGFFVSPSAFTFTVVGDVTPEEIAALAARYLGDLPAAANRKTKVDRGLRLKAVGGPESIRITGKGDLADRASVSAFYESEAPFSHKRSVQLSVLRRILSRRLRLSVREERGGVYSISAKLRLQAEPAPLFKASVSFTCDPYRVDELIPLTESMIRDMGTTGVTQQEVELAVKQSLTTLSQVEKKDRYWLNTIATSLDHNWDLSEVLSRKQMLQNTTVDDLNALAKETLTGIKGFITVYAPDTEEAL
ncbi:M16 family metallopeptidase [Desulfoluna butyratoxydans]|uniref:Peptidase m16 c-terminal n=1 Tax=Desulfoluna butyratoxydans TaxID=231438 RepID=A0A4U8YW75_9BACT|nr:M16 family metallopeptidase [Desulfoluna butyratoxydans]VFQ46252.1 peptidase m16 c-terminal [Desulfoluna butyratoxydans]